MTEKEIFDDPKIQKYFGIELNQRTWSLLGKEDRTEEEDQVMIHAAHASYYHWRPVATPENFTRAEWLISRVYAVVNRPEAALYHSRRALQICLEHSIGDFDLAYANEAMARALACNGEVEQAREYYTKAKELGNAINDAEAKQYFESDFSAGPWYGMNID